MLSFLIQFEATFARKKVLKREGSDEKHLFAFALRCERIISKCDKMVFFKYNCQPRGYISEGERTIDNQSEQAATLHMITIRVILPQFTMIGRNRHRMGTNILQLVLFKRALIVQIPSTSYTVVHLDLTVISESGIIWHQCKEEVQVVTISFIGSGLEISHVQLV